MRGQQVGHLLIREYVDHVFSSGRRWSFTIDMLRLIAAVYNLTVPDCLILGGVLALSLHKEVVRTMQLLDTITLA